MTAEETIDKIIEQKNCIKIDCEEDNCPIDASCKSIRNAYELAVKWKKKNEKNKEKERWRAKKGKKYYFINDGGNTWDTVEHLLLIDKERYVIGNYYRTEEEAVTAQKRVLRAYKC